MKFEVWFSDHIRFGQRWVTMRGEGAIHLQELGLIVVGQKARFNIPFLRDFLSRMMQDDSMLTIPYSRIISHISPASSDGYHELKFKILEEMMSLSFKVLWQHEVFSKCLQECMETAKKLNSKRG